MRKIYFLFIICFLSAKVFSQTPSTFAGVYNFNVGDSLEYEFRIDWDDPGHTYSEGFVFFTVLGVVQDSSTISYQVSSQVYYTAILNPLHYPFYTNPPPFSYSLSLKDSSILYALKDSDTLCMEVYDSVYINQQFNGSRQNEVYRMCFESNWGQKFVDSLGQVSRHAYHQNSGFGAGERQSLVYYHKANGAQWGTPYYFLVQGIDDFTDARLNAQISPNPVKSTFQLHITEAYHEKATFKLFDALGREVKREFISSGNATLGRDNLSNGVYFWQLETEGKIVERGKLVFE